MKIAFIGGGNMGEAMLAAVLSKGISASQTITVSDIKAERRSYLEQKFGVKVTESNKEAIKNGEVVVLSIKPQNLVEAMAELKGLCRPEQLVLSIIAGARINTLLLGLNHGSIVRAMPNTPAQIGEGMSVWVASPEVTARHKEWAKSILAAMGDEISVDDEKYIDMATAVSGSGPAYFFLFVEALVDAGVQIGLQRDMAKQLVLQTMLGSARFIQQSGREPAELRRMVTSPGGTTAEAISEFEKGGFSHLVTQAVSAAYHRAKQLGD